MYRYYLSAKYLIRRPIHFLGSIGVMVAVAALIAVGSVFQGFIDEVRKHVRGASPALAYVDDTTKTSFVEFEKIALADPSVTAVAPRIVWDALLFFEGQTGRRNYTRIADRDPRTTDYFRIVGIDWKREQKVSPIREWLGKLPGRLQNVADVDRPFWVDDDRAQKRGDFGYQEDGVLIGFSRTLRNVPPTGVGQRVRLASARAMPGAGLEAVTWKLVVSGVFNCGPGLRNLENQTAFVDIETLREIFGEDLDDPDSVDIVSEVSIAVRDESEMDAIAARLNVAAKKAGLQGRVVTWEERNERFLAAVEIEQNVMKIVLTVLVVVASFLIFALLSVTVASKTRDIGILAALGATRRGVLSIFLWNGAAIALVGTALGLAAGYGIVKGLNPFNNWLKDNWGIGMFPREIYGSQQVPYVIDFWWFVQVAIVTIVIALIFSFLPALRAARFDPARAFRHE